jgi:hypothetical protein
MNAPFGASAIQPVLCPRQMIALVRVGAGLTDGDRVPRARGVLPERDATEDPGVKVCRRDQHMADGYIRTVHLRLHSLASRRLGPAR